MKKWKVMLLSGVAVVSAALVVGFTAATLPKDQNLNLKPSVKYPVKDFMKARLERKIGVGDNRGLELVATLKLDRHLLTKLHYVTGTIVLKTPTGSIPIEMNPKETLDLLTMPDGRPIYYGALTGRVQGKDNPVSMTIAFVPGGEEQYAAVTIGAMGEEAEVIFGESFFTPELMAHLQGQIGQ